MQLCDDAHYRFRHCRNDETMHVHLKNDLRSSDLMHSEFFKHLLINKILKSD